MLYLTLENISTTKIATNLAVLLHADPELYKIDTRYVQLTPIVPGCPLKIDFDVSVPIDAEGMLPDLTPENSIIRVMVIKDGLVSVFKMDLNFVETIKYTFLEQATDRIDGCDAGTRNI